MVRKAFEIIKIFFDEEQFSLAFGRNNGVLVPGNTLVDALEAESGEEAHDGARGLGNRDEDSVQTRQ